MKILMRVACVAGFLLLLSCAIGAAAEKAESDTDAGKVKGWERVFYFDADKFNGASIRVRFTPDGDGLLAAGCEGVPESQFGCKDGAIALYNLADGKEKWRMKKGKNLFSLLNVRDDGRWAAAGLSGDVLTGDLSGKALTEQLAGGQMFIFGNMAGGSGMYVSTSGSVFRLDMADGSLKAIIEQAGKSEVLDDAQIGMNGDVIYNFAAPHPDGGWLLGAFVKKDQKMQLLHIDASGKTSVIYENADIPAAFYNCVVLADGSYILSSGVADRDSPYYNRLIHLDKDGKLLKEAYTGRGAPSFLRVSRDGKYLFVGQEFSRVTAWKLPGLEFAAVLPETEQVRKDYSNSETFAISTEPAHSLNWMDYNPGKELLALGHMSGYISVWRPRPDEWAAPDSRVPVELAGSVFTSFRVAGDSSGSASMVISGDQGEAGADNDGGMSSGLKLKLKNAADEPLMGFRVKFFAKTKDGKTITHTVEDSGYFVAVGEEISKDFTDLPPAWKGRLTDVKAEPLLLVYRGFRSWTPEKGWDAPPAAETLQAPPADLLRSAEAALYENRIFTAYEIVRSLNDKDFSDDVDQARTALGALLGFMGGYFSDSKAMLDKGLEKYPDSDMIHYAMGLYYLTYEGELEEAEKQFEKSAELSPKNLQAEFNLALVRLQLGKTAEGVQLLEKLAADPELKSLAPLEDRVRETLENYSEK